MREYEEGYPVDANDRWKQGEHPDPDRRNGSNFGFAGVKRNAVPGGNKAREDATDYLNERLKVMPYESTEVLFDQRVEFAGTGNGMMVFNGEPLGLLETGKTYTVTYNGEKYNCVASDVSDDGTVVAIGNKIIFGMDTGEPFLIITGFDGGDIQECFFSILSLNGDTSATIKIEKSVIHTIDPKFLPETGAIFNVNGWYESGEYVFDKTYEQIKAAEEAKTPIVGTLTLPDGKVFTMIGCDSTLPTVNLVAFNLNSTPDIGVYHVSIDEKLTNVAFFSITATQGDASDVYPK